MFKKRIWVDLPTIRCLCIILGPVLWKFDTNIRKCISIYIYIKVALTLKWLGSGNTLIMYVDLYRVKHNISLIIVDQE